MLKPDSILGRRISAIAVGALLATALLTGCGQKGALYLPHPPGAAASAPAQAASR